MCLHELIVTTAECRCAPTRSTRNNTGYYHIERRLCLEKRYLVPCLAGVIITCQSVESTYVPYLKKTEDRPRNFQLGSDQCFFHEPGSSFWLSRGENKKC